MAHRFPSLNWSNIVLRFIKRVLRGVKFKISTGKKLKSEAWENMRWAALLFLTILFTVSFVKATTWNEPWQEEVVKNADSFVKARITESGEKAISAEIIKQLGGDSVPAKFDISGYSSLNLVSFSSASHELAPPFRAGQIYYLLLKKSPKNDGSYQIATPTAGYAFTQDGNVYATYRHSYHLALIPEDVYEKTMTAIFLSAKGKAFDKTYMDAFIKEQLALPVGVIRGDGRDADSKRFFLQHAALESVYHLGTGADMKTLAPFLESGECHVQISAVRAAGKINDAGAKETLMKFIEGTGCGFAKVMGVWGLDKLQAAEMKPRLENFLKSGTDEKTGFGGNIMDPRIGTYFPDSVKESIKSMLEKWAKPVAKS